METKWKALTGNLSEFEIEAVQKQFQNLKSATDEYQKVAELYMDYIKKLVMQVLNIRLLFYECDISDDQQTCKLRLKYAIDPQDLNTFLYGLGNPRFDFGFTPGTGNNEPCYTLSFDIFSSNLLDEVDKFENEDVPKECRRTFATSMKY